jgi:hypothetical protein
MKGCKRTTVTLGGVLGNGKPQPTTLNGRDPISRVEIDDCDDDLNEQGNVPPWTTYCSSLGATREDVDWSISSESPIRRVVTLLNWIKN